jgi:hypothetical protein
VDAVRRVASVRRVLALVAIVAVVVALDPWGHAPRVVAHPAITSKGMRPAGPAGPYGPIP